MTRIAALLAASVLVVLAAAPSSYAKDPKDGERCIASCARGFDHCMKNARNDRERAECPFDKYECERMCRAKDGK